MELYMSYLYAVNTILQVAQDITTGTKLPEFTQQLISDQVLLVAPILINLDLTNGHKIVDFIQLLGHEVETYHASPQ